MTLQPSPADADLATIVRRYFASLLPTRSADIKEVVNAAANHLRTQKPDGTWPDVDYASPDRTFWGPSDHILRLHRLVKAFVLLRQSKAPSAAFRDGALRSLAWWLQNDPQCPNWWWNQIGVPEFLGDILVLLDEHVSPAQKIAALEIMKRSKPGAAGANLVWLCENQIVRGVLSGDTALVDDAYRRIYGEIRVVPGGEGIQADWSFHQHGDQFYSGSYGLSFVNDCLRYTAFAWGTRFQIPPNAMQTLTNFILQGQQWMIRGDTFDHSAVGREIARPGKRAVQRSWLNGPVSPYGAAYGLLNGVSLLAHLPVPERQAFDKMARRLEAGDKANPPGEIVGNRHFWRSDYMAHRRAGYFASVRMVSTRLQNTEVVNGEGLRSHHIADGTTFFYQTGSEFRDIFPVWDWHCVPGTTAEKDEPLPPNTVSHRGATDFVGGVSDGTVGLAVMDFVRGPLSLRKAWFCFDAEIVCLGANITGTSDRRIVTTVNQCWARGPIEKGDNWICHDSIGYGFPQTVPPSPSPLVVVEKRTGSWADIGAGSRAPLTGDVFLLTLDHGVRPAGATYAYVVVPGASGSAMQKCLTNDPVQIIANNANCQAVWQRETGIVQAVFYKPGSLSTETEWGAITVDTPCALLFAETKNGVWCAVSNPRNAPLSVVVTVGRRVFGEGCLPGDGKTTRIAFSLPGGSQAGQSVVRTLRRTDI